MAGSGVSLQRPERPREQNEARNEVETFHPDRELVADAVSPRAFP